MNKKALEFYIKQSEISCAGKWTSYLDSLPDDIGLLCDVTHKIMRHFTDKNFVGDVLSNNQLAELDLRYVEKMLTRIFNLDHSSFFVERNYSRKLIGCCRDFSLLLCCFLRHKKIPARLRFGFAMKHIPGFFHDQTLLEYFDQSTSSWCLVDARADDSFISRFNLKDYTPLNLSRENFMTPANVWLHCRSGKYNSDRFGSLLPKRMSGWWFIRNKLLQDIAALNKIEMLQWDCWGAMLENKNDIFSISDEQFIWLDNIAAKMIETDNSLDYLQDIYLDSKIKVPKNICSYSLAYGEREINYKFN